VQTYVADRRKIVFRASALSKRLPRALKSLRFCSSESPSLSSNRTRSFIAVMPQDPSFSFNDGKELVGCAILESQPLPMRTRVVNVETLRLI
jgi:hypothetical protein